MKNKDWDKKCPTTNDMYEGTIENMNEELPWTKITITAERTTPKSVDVFCTLGHDTSPMDLESGKVIETQFGYFISEQKAEELWEKSEDRDSEERWADYYCKENQDLRKTLEDMINGLKYIDKNVIGYSWQLDDEDYGEAKKLIIIAQAALDKKND